MVTKSSQLLTLPERQEPNKAWGGAWYDNNEEQAEIKQSWAERQPHIFKYPYLFARGHLRNISDINK